MANSRQHGTRDQKSAHNGFSESDLVSCDVCHFSGFACGRIASPEQAGIRRRSVVLHGGGSLLQHSCYSNNRTAVTAHTIRLRCAEQILTQMRTKQDDEQVQSLVSNWQRVVSKMDLNSLVRVEKC